MANKQKYRELCKIEPSIPIFSRDWWMDAVCGEDNWDVLLVEKGGQILASLPYYLKKKIIIAYINQPILTQTNGVWIKYPENQKYAKKLGYGKDIMESVIQKIVNLKIAFFNQNFHYSFTNWLPFYWKGFKQTTRYTYVLEDLSDLEIIYSYFETKIRTDIKKAQKQVQIKENCDLKTFYSINKMTFEEQGIKVPYSLEYLKKIDNACKIHHCRKIFYAEDEKQRIHVVLYLVWDENSAYYLMGGRNVGLQNSGSNSLLMWNAIKFASQVTKRLDFEGSMIESVERFFRAFGAIQKPYFNISKTFSPILRIKESIRYISKG